MIYVASPYSSELATIRHKRYEEVRRWTFNRIAVKQECLFSPIVYMHEHAVNYNLPTDAEFWWRFNQQFLIAARQLYVLQLTGWQESLGVKQEVKFAGDIIPAIPVTYFSL